MWLFCEFFFTHQGALYSEKLLSYYVIENHFWRVFLDLLGKKKLALKVELTVKVSTKVLLCLSAARPCPVYVFPAVSTQSQSFRGSRVKIHYLSHGDDRAPLLRAALYTEITPKWAPRPLLISVFSPRWVNMMM